MSTPFSPFFEKINQISPLEAEFTEALSAIALTPKTLYFRGKMPENMVKNKKQGAPSGPPKSGSRCRPVVAIVGSRHNTRYGEEIAYKLAYELGRRGAIIVSGLAFGIDSIGHRGCLDAGGTTVAILGTPIDQIYPKPHLGLARRIIEEGGAIISEYPPGAGNCFPQSTSFLARNRIISGLSDVVIVVEAAERSGSLNTATHALEQGKDVYAVPGNINNPYSQGTNKLIRQGATPITCLDDILQPIFPEEYSKNHRRLRQKKLIGDTDVETLILQSIAKNCNSGEEIMQESKLPPEVYSQTITLLEIKGRIRSLGADHWALI